MSGLSRNDLLSAWYDGESNLAESAEAERRVSSEPAAAAELADYRKISALLQTSQSEAPSGLLQTIERKLHAHPPANNPRGHRRAAALAAVAAALALTVLIAILPMERPRSADGFVAQAPASGPEERTKLAESEVLSDELRETSQTLYFAARKEKHRHATKAGPSDWEEVAVGRASDGSELLPELASRDGLHVVRIQANGRAATLDALEESLLFNDIQIAADEARDASKKEWDTTAPQHSAANGIYAEATPKQLNAALKDLNRRSALNRLQIEPEQPAEAYGFASPGMDRPEEELVERPIAARSGSGSAIEPILEDRKVDRPKEQIRSIREAQPPEFRGQAWQYRVQVPQPKRSDDVDDRTQQKRQSAKAPSTSPPRAERERSVFEEEPIRVLFVVE